MIPIYTTSERHPNLNENCYFIKYGPKKEPEIVNEIVNFLKNYKVEKNPVLLKIPRHYQIFISGATGVGKSTIARNLLNIIPEFVIIEESDMLREAVRGENDRIIQKISEYAIERNRGRLFSRDVLKDLLEYDILKKSTIDLQYNELNEQCKLILDPLEKVCYRLMDKGMPAIIEGVNLSFEAMFEKPDSLYKTDLDSKDALFLNLYLDDEIEHKNRLIQRSNDRRENYEIRHKYLHKLDNIRRNNNIQRQKADEYSKRFFNVHNINTTGSIENTIQLIIKKIQNTIEHV